MSDKENLPTVQDEIPPLELNEPLDLHDTASQEEAARADLPLANSMLKALYIGWGQVRTITSMCKLVDATIKATKHRRDVLRIPYGAEGKDSGSRTIAYPLD